MNTQNPASQAGLEKTEIRAVATLHRLEERREILERARSYPQHQVWLMVVSLLGIVSLVLAVNFSLQLLTFTAFVAMMVVQVHVFQINRRIDAVMRILTDHMEAAKAAPESRDALR